MKFWHRTVTSLTQDEIRQAVNDDAWQHFRLSLKGISTEDKLIALDTYLRMRERRVSGVTREEQVRVDNYINALLRGGQLKRMSTGSIRVQR